VNRRTHLASSFDEQKVFTTTPTKGRANIMGKLVVTEFITLDGVIEDPGGSEKSERGGWAFQFDRGQDGDKFKFDELMASDAQLLGRVTYEGFAKAWPTMEGTGEFGEKMNEMPKFVVSTTLENPEWNNTTVLKGDLAEEVGKLKQRFAGDILVAGSAQLVQSLLAHDLVDEFHLMVFPVVLGSGKRLFADGADTKALNLVETMQTGSVARLTLRRER
jgi:dihydrofolate reductase